MNPAEKNNPIVYITRDLERALGMEPGKGYAIVTNKTPYLEMSQERYSDHVFSVDPETDPRTMDQETIRIRSLLDTAQLIDSPATKAAITKVEAETGKIAEVLVFKNTSLIEELCKKRHMTLLNPAASLAEKIENKLTQIDWLGELGKQFLIPTSISAMKDVVWQKEPMVVQWAHGHTGDGTILVNSGAELEELKKKFPDRVARISRFVVGPSFTMNLVVSSTNIHLGNISYQITGLTPFTENFFSTVGNDWSLTHTLLSDTEIEEIEDMAREIGLKMLQDGWRGLCGIDLIKDNERNTIHLVEINARQPASTTLESYLQMENRKNGIEGITIFEAHVAALRGQKISDKIIPVNDGAQIVQRLTSEVHKISDEMIGALISAGYKVVPYTNTEKNADLIRVQSMRGIMEAHAKLNNRGKNITEILSKPA